jgi:hypothetical protein
MRDRIPHCYTEGVGHVECAKDEKAIFLAALEQPTREEREAYL